MSNEHFTCCGYDIYFDDLGRNACRWIVNDGTNRIRCISRMAAVNYCIELASSKIELHGVENVYRASEYLALAWQLIHEAAQSTQDKYLERCSVMARRVCDELRKYIDTLNIEPAATDKRQQDYEK